jgi:uncharacterized RDD family membrane protein YckC
MRLVTYFGVAVAALGLLLGLPLLIAFTAGRVKRFYFNRFYPDQLLAELNFWKVVTTAALAGAFVIFAICQLVGPALQEQGHKDLGTLCRFGSYICPFPLVWPARNRYLRFLRALRARDQPHASLATGHLAVYLRGFSRERKELRDRSFRFGFQKDKASMAGRVVEAALLTVFPDSQIIALADPGNMHPLPGIKRIVANGEGWLNELRQILPLAESIVLYYSGESAGLNQEIALLRELQLTDRTLFLVGKHVSSAEAVKAERLRRQWPDFEHLLFENEFIFSEDDGVDLVRRIRRTLQGSAALPDVPYEPGSLWNRVCAFPVDVIGAMLKGILVAFALSIPLFVWAVFLHWSDATFQRVANRIFPLLLWPIPMFLILADGGRASAGFGKQERKIRVLSAKHQPISKKRAAARGLTKMATGFLPMIVLHYGFQLGWETAVLSVPAGVGIVLAMARLREDRRTVYDLLTGTAVVSVLLPVMNDVSRRGRSY